MTSIGSMIASSARLGLVYADRLSEGVTNDNFARFANPEGMLIESNHPAFIIGHLSLYPCRIIEQLGDDATEWQPSDKFNDLFSRDAKCINDPNRAIYPPIHELNERFVGGYSQAITSLENAADETFRLPNPRTEMVSKFPTIGAMHGFYAGGHLMMHLGQFSAWRRMVGLGSA